MSRRTGRIIPSGPCTALHIYGRLICCRPKQVWSEWTRHIGSLLCVLLAVVVHSWRDGGSDMAKLLRYATWWRFPRFCQNVKHRLCIKEKQNVSTAETHWVVAIVAPIPGSSNEASLAFAEQPLTTKSDNELAPNLTACPLSRQHHDIPVAFLRVDTVPVSSQ
jgi:hypothetical protein